MPKKKSPSSAKPRFKCVMCSTETVDCALCRACKERIDDSGHNPALYCQLCDCIRPAPRVIDGLSIMRSGTALTIVIYDEFVGCPGCSKRPDDCVDDPHPTTYRQRFDAA